MIAALPMYDRPETQDATDRFWALIRDRLRAGGIPAPDHLTRDRDPWDIWTDPDLVLAQTCGLPSRVPTQDTITGPAFQLKSFQCVTVSSSEVLF